MNFLRQLFQKRGEFVRHFAPLLRRNVSGDDCFAERGEVVAEHIFLHAPESVDDRRDLMNDVQTIAFGVNHFRQAANLSFDAREARQLAFVTDFNAAVRRFVGFFFCFTQFSLSPYLN